MSMAVMSTQPLVSELDKTVSSTPAPAAVGSTEQLSAMDVDTNGQKTSEPSVAPPAEESLSSKQDMHVDTNGSRSPYVNGNSMKINAPPSPPIPTPPLFQSSNDNTNELHDLHITSPVASFPVSIDGVNDVKMADSNHEETQNGEEVVPENSQQVAEAPSSGPSSFPSASSAPAEGISPTTKVAREREDEDDEGRPTKRAKTEDEPEQGGLKEADWTGPMTLARTKFIAAIIASFRRSKAGRPFNAPVDTVKLAVPTYYDIVTSPMDLQTIERKLQTNKYAFVQELVSDFKQILENTILFNGPDHLVTASGRQLFEVFSQKMATLPPENVADNEPAPKDKKKKKATGAARNRRDSRAQKAPASRRESRVSAASPPAPSPTYALTPAGMPQIRRDSLAADGRPKREIHPPAPRDLPYSSKPMRKRNQAELKFCDVVMRELMMKRHEQYAFPFYVPVDPVALNIPDYFKIVKQPMDLGTIKDNLKKNIYESADEFERDIRLMFNNCYRFNPANQPVHQFGRKLEEVFDTKWKERPEKSVSPPPGAYDDSEEEEEQEDVQNITDLEKKLEAMQEQIAAMKQAKKKSPPAGAGSKAKKGNASKSKKSKSKKNVPYISLDQKMELSERINGLPPKKMGYAMSMIQENMPELGSEDGQIELDIDELDPSTLQKLYQYVCRHTAPLANKPYVPHQPVESPQESKSARKPSLSKPRKNKPMTADEQERRIRELQGTLAGYQNPGAAPPSHITPAAPQDESSDDEESSASESEEE